MEGVKSLFASKTVWGLIIAALGFLAQLMGFTVTEADQTSLATIVANLAEGVGMLIALWGRISATKTIGAK